MDEKASTASREASIEKQLQRVIELLEAIATQQERLELLGVIARKLGVKFVDG